MNAFYRRCCAGYFCRCRGAFRTGIIVKTHNVDVALIARLDQMMVASATTGARGPVCSLPGIRVKLLEDVIIRTSYVGLGTCWKRFSKLCCCCRKRGGLVVRAVTRHVTAYAAAKSGGKRASLLSLKEPSITIPLAPTDAIMAVERGGRVLMKANAGS